MWAGAGQLGSSWEGEDMGAWQTRDEQETAVCPGSNKTEPSSGPC